MQPPKQAATVDPTHEKLLAVFSQSARFPDTAAVGAAMSATDLPPASPGDGEMPPTMDPVEGRPPQQAASSGLPVQQCPSHGHIQYRIAEDGMREHLPPKEVPCPVNPQEGTIAPPLMLARTPGTCVSSCFLQTFGSER